VTNKQIDLKVKIYSEIPINHNRHIVAYPSIKQCLEYKQKLIEQSKSDES